MYDLRAKAIKRFEAGERRPLLTVQNAKTNKSVKFGYLTAILHLSPADMISKKTLCPFASTGCKAACLNTAGRGGMHMLQQDGVHRVQDARALRTIWYERDRATFMRQLEKEITRFISKAGRENLIPAIRLNGTSDFLVERTGIIQKFPDVQFYDYTAIPISKRRNLPANYHLTFSRKEDNEAAVDEALTAGLNVAVVFDKLPDYWKGIRVIDGDESDLRFLDEEGVIVGLKHKGSAKENNSGFVVISESFTDNSVLEGGNWKVAA